MQAVTLALNWAWNRKPCIDLHARIESDDLLARGGFQSAVRATPLSHEHEVGLEMRLQDSVDSRRSWASVGSSLDRRVSRRMDA